MKSFSETYLPAVDYASLELKSSAGDNNAWLISYLDIFILTAALFASLLAFEQNQPEANAALPVQQPFSEASANTRTGNTATANATPAGAAKARIAKASPTTSHSTNTKAVAPQPAAADTAIASTITTATTADSTGDELVRAAEPDFSGLLAGHHPFSSVNSHHFELPASPVKSQQDQWQNSTALAMQRHAFDNNIHTAFKNGYAEMSIGSAVLFAAAEAELLSGGTQVLDRLIGFLKESEGMIVIQGHTDSSPIKSADYPSNWELASARANNVLHYLLAHGLKRERLRAVSFADTKPIVANDSESNRQKNRRVNIVLLSPGIDDLAYQKHQALLTASENSRLRNLPSVPAVL